MLREQIHKTAQETHQKTGIFRVVDPTYPTNLAILLGAGGVGLITLAVDWQSGAGWLELVYQAVGYAALAFLSWVIARELDPDHEYAAFVSAAAAVSAARLLGLPAFLPLFGLIVLLRFANRSPGAPMHPGDSLFAVVWAFVGAFVLSPLYALWAALLLFWDAQFPNGEKRHQRTALFMLPGILVLWAVFPGWLALLAPAAPWVGRWAALPVFAWPSGLDWAAIGVTAIFLAFALASPAPRAVGDYDQRPLNPGRVRAAQILAVGLVILSLLTHPGGAAVLSSLWAAMVGPALFWLGRLLFTRQRG